MGAVKDLTGQKFGRLTVLERVGSDKRKNALWLCECECGSRCIIAGYSLKSGRTASCGCLQRDWAKKHVKSLCDKHIKHGMRNTRLYRIWLGILSRTGVYACEKPSNSSLRYIERGIKVCDEWEKFEAFKDWALSHGYADNLVIDRIDNDGFYTPNNCRWVTVQENTNNRECTRRWNGVPITEICRAVGIETFNYDTYRMTVEFSRISDYYRRHNGDLPPDIKARYEAYLKESC